MKRRRFALIVGLMVLWTKATAMPALLETALLKLQADEDHWAYTQTTQAFDRKGAPDGGPTVERYDPSQPPAQQWQLIQWQGQDPGERDLRRWEKRKLKEQRRREEKTLGEVMDFDRATVREETEEAVVFAIPLQPGASKRLPAEKFMVQMTVDRAREVVTGFSLETTGSFRAMGVAKIDTIEVRADFRTVDERYAPQPHAIQARGAGRVLFFRVGGAAEIAWSDFKRVKPYNDRFEVRIGELKAFGF
jgi:hypothetical protein